MDGDGSRQRSSRTAASSADDDFATYRRTGDRQVRDRLVREHLDEVVGLVSSRLRQGVDPELVRRIVTIGLIKALQGLDPDTASAFPDVAAPIVLRELAQRGLADSVAGPPVLLEELGRRVLTARDRLASQDGRSRTLATLAREVGMGIDDVLLAMEFSPTRCEHSTRRLGASS